jgi:hypothetical protein
MSSDERRGRNIGVSVLIVWIASGVISSVLVAVVLGLMGLFQPAPKARVASTGSQESAEESDLAEGQEALARESDLAACKLALVKTNSHLNRHPEQRPTAPIAAEQAKLRDVFGLTPAEITEAEGVAYTTLDAHHVDQCLLLRDAARALDAEEMGPNGKPLRPGPLDRASAAFAWVVREIRPVEYYSEDPVPPAYVLRRGWGNSLERSLAFLALLEQDAGPEKLRGCLLTLPGAEKTGQRLWACGVVIGDGKDVYLFDPRLGLPLPGPGGEGVATLATAAKDPAVLGQLDSGPDHLYDVKPEQARTAEGWAVFTVSSLAPRMRYLQDTLFNHSLRAQLSADPADLDRLREAVKASGAAAGVKVFKPGIGLLARFLPVSEGGTDTERAFPAGELRGFTYAGDRTPLPMTRMRLFEMTMVPWEALPQEFNPQAFPTGVGLGQRVRLAFAVPFTKPVREARGARDLLLRGRYTQAAPKLVSEQNELRENLMRRASAKDLDKDVAEWLKAAREAYVYQARAQNAKDGVALADANKRIDYLWGKPAEPIGILLFGASSGPREAEVTYQLGLCMHEPAEQEQARLDLLARAGLPATPADVDRCRDAWRDAKDWWVRFTTNYGAGIAAGPARRNRARAEAMLGDWESAAKTFGDTSGTMTPPEKIAALYNARQAKKHLMPKK